MIFNYSFSVLMLSFDEFFPVDLSLSYFNSLALLGNKNLGYFLFVKGVNFGVVSLIFCCNFNVFFIES